MDRRPVAATVASNYPMGLWCATAARRDGITRPFLARRNDRQWSVGYLYLQVGPRPVPLRHYAIVIGMICGGFGLGGITQALRVLVGIARTIQPH